MTRTALFPKPIIAIGLSLALLTTAAPGFTAESDGIQWVHSLEAAKTQAKAENKLIFMDVYAEWCGPCKIMARDTFPDPTVIKALENYVSVKIDADKAPEITRQYRILGVPTLFVLTADGAPLHQESGSLPPEGILALLETAKVRLEKITALEKEVHMAPDNVSKAVELARMYTDTGRAADAVTLLESTQPKIESVSQSTKGDFMFALGLAYLLDRAYDKGVQTLEQFVEAQPAHAESERAKDLIPRGKVFDAMARVDKGEYDQAAKILTQLTKTSTEPQITRFAENMLAQLEVLGKPAPDWDVTWVGEQSPSPQTLKGKVVALAFVEPEGGQSAEIAQKLQALKQEHGGEGLETVAIVSSLDGAQAADAANVRTWIEENSLTCPVAIDGQGRSTLERYKGQRTPWFVLIGRDGVVHYLGTFDEGEVRRKLTSLLGVEAPA